MGRETGIAWCDHTASFWMGCQRVSPGCEHCYAEALVTKRMRLPVWGPPSTTERKRTLSAWRDVPAWDRAAKRDGVRRRLFVSSLADIFEEHPQVAPWRADALALLERCTSLDVLLLTKRPQNIRAMVPSAWLDAWPAHVWIGTTVEDQKRAEERIPELLRVPALVRFLSCEPLLEEVDLTRWLRTPEAGDPRRADLWCARCGHAAESHWCEEGDDDSCLACEGCDAFVSPSIQWVIVGGESGPGARPFDLAWARRIVRHCLAAGVAVFVKQMGDAPIDSDVVEVLNHDGTSVAYRRPSSDPDKLLAEARSRGRVLRPMRVTGLGRAGADPSLWPEDLRVQEFPTKEDR